MFPSIQVTVVDEHQRALRLEAERERLATGAAAPRPRGSGGDARSGRTRLGQTLADRLVRLVAAGR